MKSLAPAMAVVMVLILVLHILPAQAQVQYSTQDKKAIKSYEAGVE